jgi:hypothetical protein
MEVPDFGGRDLTLSSITLAERIARIEGPSAPQGKAPYAFGNLLVIPKPGIAFASGQEFAFYFQVYHARLDAQTGAPHQDVRYEFLSHDGEGYRPFGSPLELPGQTQASQGFAFPLEGWKIGQYRLRVTVTDRLSGAAARREVDFLVR